MYNNVKLLSKTEHKESKYLDSLDLFKDIKVLSVGLKEITKLACMLPVVISGGKEQRFVVVAGLKENYFTKNRCKDLYIPAAIRTYPFIMVDAKEENSEKKLRAIAIDEDALSENGKAIYEKEDKFTDYTAKKIELLKQYDLDLMQAKRLVNQLKEWNVLEKANVEIDVNGEKRRVLSDFYVVNRKKLFSLPDKTLLKLAEDGIVSILDAHISSISNITKLLS